MARRTADWNAGLAKDLRDPAFARAFILAAVEDEGLPPRDVLAKVIRLYGIKEFARKVRMAPPNLVRALGPRANPTQEMLQRLLKPFGLQLTIAPLRPKSRSAA